MSVPYESVMLARERADGRPVLCDLYSGAGGAARGYQMAGFYVVGIDNRPQPRYAGDEFVQADALGFLLEGFDAVHASPPCQAYVDSANKAKHPKLIEPTRARLVLTKQPFVIENVDKAPLLFPIRLCGTFFGLRVIRHRHFETWPRLGLFDTPCNHWGRVSEGTFAGVYGRGGRGARYIDAQGRHKRVGPVPKDSKATEFFAAAMGIEAVLTRYELTQAIPPAYAHYIGTRLMALLRPS